LGDATFCSLDEVSTCLERVLAASPADETELVWLERRRGRADARGGGVLERPRASVLVRVVEGGRLGWFRTEVLDCNELESAVRQALALAKVQPRMKKRPVLQRDGEANAVTLPPSAVLLDPAIEQLDVAGATERLRALCPDGERARLRWSANRLAIFNSHGLRRAAAATDVSLEVAAGLHAGGGRAAGAARTFEALAPERILERARSTHAEPGTPQAAPASGSIPVLLSGEATIELLNLLNGYAFSARSYLDGFSFLSRHRNVQVFDRLVNLRDDGTASDGLAFPFDLEGAAKRPLDLIVDGKPSTPALNRHQGLLAGLRSTAQAVGGEDALFGNLFLLPGAAPAEELLAAADGGLYVAWLEPLECFDPVHLHVRAVARGVRRVEGGRLAAPLPDLAWEDSLLRLLARLAAVGRRPVVRVTPTTPLGAISAPPIVLDAVDAAALRPLATPAPSGVATRSRRPRPAV